MSDEEDGTTEALSTEVIDVCDVLGYHGSDPKIEEKVTEAVKRILISDYRLAQADIETIDALRDYVRIEALFSEAFQRFMSKKDDAQTERMLRALIIQKTSLRKEIWEPLKDKKGRDEELDGINKKILLDTDILDAKADLYD